MSLDLKVVIPSKDRPENVRRMAEMLPDASWVLNEAQAEIYRRAGVAKRKMILHPEDLRGIGKLRNFMLDTISNEILVWIEDDLKFILVWSGSYYKKLRKPEDIMAVITTTAQVAKDAGVSLFGWGNHARGMRFRKNDPFNFIGPISRAAGVVGRKLRWDERLVGSADTDATLQSLLTDRIIFTDTRYYFNCGEIMANKGGLQAVRTKANRDRDVALVKAKWGDYVNLGAAKRAGQMTGVPRNNIRVRRRQKGN